MINYNKEYMFFVACFLDKLHDYLLHPHSWVRLISSRLYGLLFASANIDEIADTLVDASTNVRKRKGKVWLRFFTSGGLAKVGD